MIILRSSETIEPFEADDHPKVKKHRILKIVISVSLAVLFLVLLAGGFTAGYYMAQSDSDSTLEETEKISDSTTTERPSVVTHDSPEYFGRKRTTTTAKMTTTTPSETGSPWVTPWSLWSQCSAFCSSSLNPEYLTCPTRSRTRVVNGQKTVEKQNCNCEQCPFQYDEWRVRCVGDQCCHKSSERYCRMISKDGTVLREAQSDIVENRSFYKCSYGWKQSDQENWSSYCDSRCPYECKGLGDIWGKLTKRCPC